MTGNTEESKNVAPHTNGTYKDENGTILQVPAGWKFLKAGDAGVTRTITATGPYWRIRVKKGKRLISLGVLAPAQLIEDAIRHMNQKRSTENYKKTRERALQTRERKQTEYVSDFFDAVVDFLKFHPRYEDQARSMAHLICSHATPIGSGTVARTTRIPLEQRAEKAVIAWMRHQTTEYDRIQIARRKGERRKVRSTLAKQSLNLLDAYRQGAEIPEFCPLKKALLGNQRED